MALPENAVLEGARSDAPVRRPLIDVARGIAVAAMVIYHSAWDLSELGFVETDIRASHAWGLFARAVAASFLALVGIGLVLAHGEAVRPRTFLRRLAVVAAAAAVISLVTRLVFPESYIYFGVLHNIALSSLLVLPFVRLPGLAAAAVGAGVIAAPWLLAGPSFDAPLLAFLGLGATVPATNDYVPVFPWTGWVLVGVAIGRLLRHRPEMPKPSRAPGPVGRVVAAVGRRSLAIYLLHQPLIFGALWAVREIVGPNPAAEAAPFLRNCVATCSATEPAETCRASCACTLEELKRDGLWPVVLAGRPSGEELARASALARMCLKRVE